MGSLASHNPIGFHGLLRGYLYCINREKGLNLSKASNPGIGFWRHCDTVTTLQYRADKETSVLKRKQKSGQQGWKVSVRWVTEPFDTTLFLQSTSIRVSIALKKGTGVYISDIWFNIPRFRRVYSSSKLKILHILLMSVALIVEFLNPYSEAYQCSPCA
jgi:hypothetical protein